MANGYQPKFTRSKLWTYYRSANGDLRPVSELTQDQQWEHWMREGLIPDQTLTRERALELFQDNQGLVYKFVWKFTSDKDKDYYARQDELTSPAQHGLWCGILRFDHTLGFKMSTFLSHYIIGYIKTYIYEMGNKSTLKRYVKLVPFTDCPITDKEGNEDEFFAVDHHEPPNLDGDQDKRILKTLMGKLPKRTRIILKQRHWRAFTLEEIAAAHDISKERARQILIRAIWVMQCYAKELGIEWEGVQAEPGFDQKAYSFQRPRRRKAKVGK